MRYAKGDIADAVIQSLRVSEKVKQNKVLFSLARLAKFKPNKR